jgi:16S rRNA (guanine527-N7)-methyltransferase
MSHHVTEQADYEALLRGATEKIGVSLSDLQVSQLLTYAALFFKWNQAYNLSSIQSMHALIIRHLIDSLSVLPYLPTRKRMLDVGSGAGLPGIPIAIARPDLMLTLLDANGKKSCFLRQVVNNIPLCNVGILQTRVEEYQPKKPFDLIIARAFASAGSLLKLREQCYAEPCRVIAMKGIYPNAELEDITYPYEVVSLDLPFEELQHRHLVIIEVTSPKTDP